VSLPAMRLAVARLLTDPAYQARFFAAREEAAAEFGLTREEFAALRTLDRRKLAITTEGFAGKRLEPLNESFPLTLAAMGAHDPDAARRYLASTPHPANLEMEAASLGSYLAHAEVGPPHVRRYLLDLRDAEWALARAPRPRGLASYRFVPDALRPRRTPFVPVVDLRGALGSPALASGPMILPREYPEAPQRALVVRLPGGIATELLTPEREALLAACDGVRTLRDLAAQFGPSAEAAVAAWLRTRAVDDASAIIGSISS